MRPSTITFEETNARDHTRPIDDGGTDHLVGLAMLTISLTSTGGRSIALNTLGARRTVIYCYPMTGRPDVPLPDG